MGPGKPFVRMAPEPKAPQNGPGTRGGPGAVLVKVWAQTCCDQHEQKSIGTRYVALWSWKSIFFNPWSWESNLMKHNYVCWPLYRAEISLVGINLLKTWLDSHEYTIDFVHQDMITTNSLYMFRWIGRKTAILFSHCADCAMGPWRNGGLWGASPPLCWAAGWWIEI